MSLDIIKQEGTEIELSSNVAFSQQQFEAIRAQNKDKYAASGFVHFGKHEAGKQVNECEPGLYTALTTPNTLLIGKASGVGGSKTDNAALNMAGVLFHLPVGFGIKFPQAPDGKTTYTKITRVITNHATVTDAFNAQEADPTNVEVVINRVDMWGFEAWLEEVNTTNPYVYPNGLIQSQAATMDGVATSASTRPVTYYAVFGGDTGSKGKGLDFFVLTDAQKKKVLANHKNNLYYLDDGRLVQWRLRQRTFAGAGNGDWLSISTATNTVDLMYSSIYTRIRVQGASIDDAGYATGESYIPKGNYSAKYVEATDPALYYLRKMASNDNKAVNGECYFLVCGTVNRLNQGAYHPSFNPSGAARFCSADGSTAVVWSSGLSRAPATQMDCFVTPTTGYPFQDGFVYLDSGKINGVGGSGRPDNRFYDAIYADGQGGVCRDMRYSAYGVDLVDFAEADQKAKNGTYRGFEFGRITKVISFITSSLEITSEWGRVPMTRAEALRVCELIGVSTTGVTFFDQAKMAVSLYNPNNGMVIHSSAIAAAQGDPHFGTYLDPANPSAIWLGFDQKVVENSLSGNRVLMIAGETGIANSNIFCSSGQSLYAIVTTLDKVSVGGSFLQTDVIGNPANILATPALAKGWKGWQGSWLPWIPDNIGSPSQVRKVLKDMGQVYSDNYGSSWLSSGWGLDVVTNAENTGGAVPANMVVIRYYQAFAKQTEPAKNAVVYGGDAGVGKVYAQSLYKPDWGCNLGESLCGIICKNTVTPEGSTQPLTRYLRNPNGEFNVAEVNSPKHAALDIASVPNNNSPAFKALTYNVNTNQQAFIQYAYTELKHNGTDWGDDGKVTIVDNQSTKPDLNGNTVLVGTAKLKEPIGWVKVKV